MKVTNHTDGTVSIRVPRSSLQGRGLGVDDLVHALHQAATSFASAALTDAQGYSADYRQLQATFQLAADDLQAKVGA